MRYVIQVAIVAVLCLVLLTGTAIAKTPAEVVRVDDLTLLVEQAREFDRKTIAFSGEVFGDRMARKDGTWINVGDPASLIVGVLAPAEVLQDVANFGRHGIAGDKVTVVGEFHRACAAHGGDLDVHATTVHVDRQGGPVHEPLKTALAWWSTGLLGASGLLYMGFVRQTKRQQAS